jgi:hypothetical protein
MDGGSETTGHRNRGEDIATIFLYLFASSFYHFISAFQNEEEEDEEGEEEEDDDDESESNDTDETESVTSDTNAVPSVSFLRTLTRGT